MTLGTITRAMRRHAESSCMLPGRGLEEGVRDGGWKAGSIMHTHVHRPRITAGSHERKRRDTVTLLRSKTRSTSAKAKTSRPLSEICQLSTVACISRPIEQSAITSASKKRTSEYRAPLCRVSVPTVGLGTPSFLVLVIAQHIHGSVDDVMIIQKERDTPSTPLISTYSARCRKLSLVQRRKVESLFAYGKP